MARIITRTGRPHGLRTEKKNLFFWGLGSKARVTGSAFRVTPLLHESLCVGLPKEFGHMSPRLVFGPGNHLLKWGLNGVATRSASYQFFDQQGAFRVQ